MPPSAALSIVQGHGYRLPFGGLLAIVRATVVPTRENGSVNHGLSTYGLFFKKNEVILYKVH